MRRLPVLALCTLMAAAAFLPFAAMLILAFSPPNEAPFPESLVPSRLTLENIDSVLSAAAIDRWALNSLLYAGVSTVVILLLASMAGYAFAKKRFRGSELLFWLVLVAFAVPDEVNLIPYFIGLSEVGGVDTYWGLILPTLANAQAVFLMRQYLRQIPDDLLDSARAEGAGEWWIYWRVVLPLARPALAVIGVFVFIWHWNDFLWPLIVAQSDEMRTLTVGLATLRTGSVPLTEQMAAATLSLVPSLVVFLTAQRYLVRGITDGGPSD